MHFAFCLYRYFPYSGLARDFLRILLEARSRGHQVDVYVNEWQGDKPQDVSITTLAAQGLTNHGRNTKFHQSFRRAIADKQYDAVVGFNKMPNLDLYYGADYCYVARAKPAYGPIYRLTPRYISQQKFERSVFHARATTTILSLSEREKSVYQQHYGTPENRFVLMPPTLDKARRITGDPDATRTAKRAELGLTANEKLALFIGSGFKTKGLDRAIEAINKLPEALKTQTRLYVVGQDNTQPYEQQIARLGLSEKVRFLGGRSDVPELMLAGDVLVHPAYSENTGTVILEAIITGLPVIATDVCGYANHIDRANTGIVLRSPFSQTKLNADLLSILTSHRAEEWRQSGRNYGQNPDLFQMPETAVDAIEAWVKQQRATAHLPHTDLPDGEHIYLAPELADAYPTPADMETILQTNGEIVREAPNRRTLRFNHKGNNYYLKAHTGVGWHEIAKNLSYGKMPVIGAQNEWHGFHHLSRLGIDTICAAGYGMVSGNPARQHSFIISQALEDTVSLDIFCAPWAISPPSKPVEIRFKRWLIRRLAEISRDMHNSGANHRDFYLIHFLLRRGYSDGKLDPETSRLFLIDLHRMQLRKRTPVRWIIKDIAGLYFSSLDFNLSNRDYFRFMRVYHSADLAYALGKEAKFWQQVKRRGARLYQAEARRKARGKIT